MRLEMREGFREVGPTFATSEVRSVESAPMRTRAFGRSMRLGLERRWLVGMWLTTALGFVALLVELHVR